MQTNKIAETIDKNFNKYKETIAKKGYDVAIAALRGSIDILEKTEKKLDESKLERRHGLENRTSDELYEMAKDLKIKGRSKMSKSQLKKALAGRLYH